MQYTSLRRPEPIKVFTYTDLCLCSFGLPQINQQGCRGNIHAIERRIPLLKVRNIQGKRTTEIYMSSPKSCQAQSSMHAIDNLLSNYLKASDQFKYGVFPNHWLLFVACLVTAGPTLAHPLASDTGFDTFQLCTFPGFCTQIRLAIVLIVAIIVSELTGPRHFILKRFTMYCSYKDLIKSILLFISFHVVVLHYPTSFCRLCSLQNNKAKPNKATGTTITHQHHS